MAMGRQADRQGDLMVTWSEMPRSTGHVFYDRLQEVLVGAGFVQLPDVGTEVTAGESFGEVESTKSVSDLYAPVTAKVVAVNGDLEGNPQLVNSDPYGEGWLLDLQVDAASLEDGLAGLLDADGYRAVVAE